MSQTIEKGRKNCYLGNLQSSIFNCNNIITNSYLPYMTKISHKGFILRDKVEKTFWGFCITECLWFPLLYISTKIIHYLNE